MKSTFLLLSLLLICACTTDAPSLVDIPTINEQTTTNVSLTLDFVTSETTWSTPNNAPFHTRAASSSEPTRIALRIFHSDGTPALDQIDQTKDDAQFGTFSGLRLTPGSYKCVIVAHRASAADKPSSTITSLTEATLPETDLWDTFATIYDFTVAANTYATQEHSITVPLCVTRLTITLLDAIPTGVSKIRLSLNSGSSTTVTAPITLNPTTGLSTTDLAYTRIWDVESHVDKTDRNFTITGLFDAYPKTCDAKIEALDAEGTTVFTRTFQNITFNRGKIRKVSTNLFTGSVDATINFEEWTDEDAPIVIP